MRWVAAAILAGLASTPVAADELIFPSSSYGGWRDLLTGAPPAAAVDIHGDLRFPSAAGGRVPAVVVVHTLGGFRPENEGWAAESLRQAGFATLTYDSFAARGLGDLVNAPRPVSPPVASGVADAFAALAALAREPRVDPDRIAIVGFSFGGEVAHDTAFTRLRQALGAGDRHFAAHVAFYPAGDHGVVADGAGYDGTPILMMIGGDDTLPVAKAKAYLAYAEAAGHPAPIELIVYPTASHAWTNPSLGAARLYPNLASSRKCPLLLIPSRGPPKTLVDGREQPLDDAAFRECVRANLGYTMGYDPETRAQSMSATIAFLKQHLAP